MKSGKVIDVSKSSLISLKAELVRKREEAQNCRGSEKRNRPSASTKKKELKINPGVLERSAKDEVTEKEVDILRKSKEVLQVKSKLYDKLLSGESVQEDEGDSYLVDFKEKLDKVFAETAPKSRDALDESDGDHSNEDSDDDGWVEYIDCLGRTRRCLRDDFQDIKERDDETRKIIMENPEPSESDGVSGTADDGNPENINDELRREKMREKWEDQEHRLLNKKNIYYEDIRFDEARTHGVAYYGFSTEESLREEEQAEFKRLREDTLAKQQETRDTKEKRDQMKQARLMAARQRQRARLGLPPLSTELDVVKTVQNDNCNEKTPDKEECKPSVKELEATLTRAAHVRPWDIGKDTVKGASGIMTQEQWIANKREERTEEFAPPQMYNFSKRKRKGNTIDSKRAKNLFESHEKCTALESEQKHLQAGHSNLCDTSPPVLKPRTSNPRFHSANSLLMKSSRDMIEAGIEFLRQRSENRDEFTKNPSVS